MIQLISYGMKDGTYIVSLLMNLFKIIKFGSIIPLPAFAKRCSQNGFTFEDNFDIILRRMNRGNSRTILKMPDFKKISLDIETRNGVNILDTLF